MPNPTVQVIGAVAIAIGSLIILGTCACVVLKIVGVF